MNCVVLAYKYSVIWFQPVRLVALYACFASLRDQSCAHYTADVPLALKAVRI